MQVVIACDSIFIRQSNSSLETGELETMNKLHPAKRADGSTQMYCGPFAICTVTGENYERVRAVVNMYRWKKSNASICGMYCSDLEDTLRYFGRLKGFTVNNVKVSTNPTLAKFLKERPPELINKVVVISLTNHFVVVKGRKFVDNHVKTPVFIRQAPFRRARVKQYWIIEHNRG